MSNTTIPLSGTNFSIKQARLIAIVGMAGAGKTEVVSYIKQKNIPTIRFGEIAEERLRELGLVIIPENEQKIREELRKEFGMAVFAIRSLPKIQALLEKNPFIIIDGLYSWEEYTFLKQQYHDLKVVHIFAEPEIRYNRLAKRPTRPFNSEQSKMRDIAEIENLHKSGPIAVADYLIENNSNLENLHGKIDELLKKL